MPAPTPWRSRRLSLSSTCTLGRVNDRDFNEISADEVVDLTIDNSPASHRPLEQGEFALASLRVSADVLRPDDCIEVQGITLGSYEINFVLVKIIARARTGKVTIRGIPFTRNQKLKDKLPEKLNEVCRILHIDQNSDEAPALVDVGVESVVKKRTLIITNAPWPKHYTPEFGTLSDEHGRRLAAESLGTLICRWSFTIYSVTQGRKSKPVEEVLERAHASEVPLAKYRESEENLCYQWRGGRIPGGSWSQHSAVTAVEIEPGETPTPCPSRYRDVGQKYTLFDAFSGAGGVSRGAHMAGFRITHALDKSEEVWPTYKANFRDTKLFRGSVDEFIKSCHRHIRVDVLHLSPPCQYFSTAHTRESKNDDENKFALLSCNSLINKVRPRFITVEQTFGIKRECHRDYLHTLINDITQFRYAVRWKVVRLCTWGSAQDRKRLVMIAAAPGERLPPFPRPTHSEDGVGGLKPYRTIGQALEGIQPGDYLHDIEAVKKYRPPRASYDPNRLAGTLTTGGADFAYPDGTRGITLRELANLQGFPRYHKFKGTRTSIKKQIGNAFPPNTVRVLYQHLERWLLNEDAVLPYQPPAGDTIMVEDQDDAIFIDDSDESSVHARGDSSERLSESPAMDDIVEVEDEMDIDGSEESPGCMSTPSRDSIMVDLT